MTKFFPRTFAKSETGSLSVEAVLVIPLLVWALTATFVFFDAFKTLNTSQKATYTIADMISREEMAITPNYLTALHETFDFLSKSDGANAVRVTVVALREDPETLEQTLEKEWSKGVGGIEGHETLDTLRDRIPDIAVDDVLIVVETEQEWAPSFAVGLASYRFREVAIAWPRNERQVKWNDS
ncbi:MAG: pilus assembly protein [Silicimonas sp.]|nr:pilus assembly protein [Silicimonas sp.]